MRISRLGFVVIAYATFNNILCIYLLAPPFHAAAFTVRPFYTPVEVGLSENRNTLGSAASDCNLLPS